MKAMSGSTLMPASPRKARLAGDGQYTLRPNPNNGVMQLQQQVQDNNPVNATVLSATGAQVYKGTLQFAGGTSKLNLGNITPGLYVLQLTDSKGNDFILKFVIE